MVTKNNLMRSILSIIALFSCCTLAAQEYIPTYGREPMRGELLVYPSAREAAEADGSDNKYFKHLNEWTQKGNSFTTDFTVPFAWANRQVLFRLGWASADYEIRVNGEAVAYNSDCNAPAEFNLTRHAKEGRNTLEVILSSPSKVERLESWKNDASPAIGAAWVMSQPTLRIRDILTKTWRSTEEGDNVMAEVGLVVKSEALNPRTSRVHYELLSPAGKTSATGYKDIKLNMRGEDTLRFLARIPDSLLWSPEKTTRFTLRVKTQHEGRYMEYIEVPLGFRTVEVQNGQLAVNGTPVTLRTREVPAHASADEIAALRGQGYNTLKLLPGPVSPTLYGTCDTLGMYVIVQAPIDTRSSGESRRIGVNPSNARLLAATGVDALPCLETASVGNRFFAGHAIGQRHQPLRKLPGHEEVRRPAAVHLSRCRRRVEQRQTGDAINPKWLCDNAKSFYCKKSGFFCRIFLQ